MLTPVQPQLVNSTYVASRESGSLLLYYAYLTLGQIEGVMCMEDVIKVKGAKTHNLKDIEVEMPRNKMIVFTGLSGSGKSSLAFDTIFAEGQRKYVESLSAYARQFLRQMQKPDVEEITGLSPAISIDQKSRSNKPRSKIRTIIEI